MAGGDGAGLPERRGRPPREFVVGSQRERMLDAMARAVADKGYRSTTVADVVSRAGVSRKTFYEHFRDIEDCFLAAYDAIVPQFVERIRQGFETEREWPAQIRSGLAALLRFLASEPEFARMCIVEVLAAGPRALERRDAVMRGLTAYFDPDLADAPGHLAAPELVAEMVVAGLYGVIYNTIAQGRTAELPALAPQLAHAALVPFLGERGARAAAARPRGPR